MEVFKLEEPKEQVLDAICLRESQLAVARVVHVNGRDGRRDHLHYVKIVKVRVHWRHQVNMVDVRAQADDQSVLVPVQNGDDGARVGLVPEHFEVLVPIVAEKDVGLGDKALVRVPIQRFFEPGKHLCGHL